jgi:hypothetical protein
MTKKVWLTVLCAAIFALGLRAAQQAAVFPAPPDILTSQAAAGGSLLAAWKWLTDPATGVLPTMWNRQQNDEALQAADEASISALQAAVANIPAGPQGPAGPIGPTGPQGMPGLQGPSLNTPQVDSDAITATSAGVTLVRQLCYPAKKFAGSIPATGGWVDFSFTVPADGTYTIAACVASQGGTHPFHVEFPAGTKIGNSVNVINTASYDAFAYQTVAQVAMTAGPATVRIVSENGGMNVAGLNYQ